MPNGDALWLTPQEKRRVEIGNILADFMALGLVKAQQVGTYSVIENAENIFLWERSAIMIAIRPALSAQARRGHACSCLESLMRACDLLKLLNGILWVSVCLSQISQLVTVIDSWDRISGPRWYDWSLLQSVTPKGRSSYIKSIERFHKWISWSGPTDTC